MNKTLIVAALATLSAASNAIIVETEPNNTFATADFLGSVPPAVLPYSNTGDIALTTNDVDYFSIDLFANSVLTLAATPLNADYTPDTVLGLFTSTGVLLKQNDDFGDTGASALVYRVTSNATFLIGVAGTGVNIADGGITGSHTQAGTYQLTVSVSPTPVPEPATMAALGLGALALIRRRNGAKR